MSFQKFNVNVERNIKITSRDKIYIDINVYYWTSIGKTQIYFTSDYDGGCPNYKIIH